MTITDHPVLVTAATGKTGRRIASQLVAAGHAVRAVSRSSDTRFDWDDPSTWASALSGARAVYLVPPGVDIAPVPPFLAAAADAGVHRVVLLSARAPGQSGDDHLERVERMVADAAEQWTVLRPSWFMQNFDEGMFAEPLASGELALPVGDGLEPFIDADDIAAVAVAALTGDGHDGRTYELSGPELLTFADAVAAIAAAGGPVARFVDADRVRDWGLPTEVVSVLTHLFDAIRAGDNAHLSHGVDEALGRPATTVATWAARAYAGRSTQVG